MEWFNLGDINLNNSPEGYGFTPPDVPDAAAQTHGHEAADLGFMSVDDTTDTAPTDHTVTTEDSGSDGEVPLKKSSSFP
jgi:hypothetical protein